MPYNQSVETMPYNQPVESTNYLGNDGIKYTKLIVVYGSSDSDILRGRYEQLFANKLNNKKTLAVSALDAGISPVNKESAIKMKKSLIEMGFEGILLIEAENLTGDWIYQIMLLDLKKGLVWKGTTKIVMNDVDFNFDNAMQIVSDNVINKMEEDGLFESI